MHLVRKPTHIFIQFNLQESKPIGILNIYLKDIFHLAILSTFYCIYIPFIEKYKNLNASSEHS